MVEPEGAPAAPAEPDPIEAFRQLLSRAGRTVDPVRRAKLRGDLLLAVPKLQEALRLARADDIGEIQRVHPDWSFDDIGRELGLHRSRVNNIVKGHTRTGNAARSAVATDLGNGLADVREEAP